MSSTNSEKLSRQQIAGLPLIHHILTRMNLKGILRRHLPSRTNELASTIDALTLLVYNLTLGKKPLYKLEDWINQIDFRCINMQNISDVNFNDDRFGRALDKLYDLDRASLLTQLVVHALHEFKIENNRIHNDSTSVKAYGNIAGTTTSGLELRRGKSKDHRPDLKQLVFTLSISSDGAVPIHYKTYPGNRTDDSTHIETWNTLCKITKTKNFLYVADCKVCTDNQLNHISNNGGRVITIIPKLWKEAKEFTNSLREHNEPKKEIWRRTKPGTHNEKEYYFLYEGEYKTHKRGYRIHWISSTEKKKIDAKSREDRLQRAEEKLTELSTKLNKRKFKVAATIEQVGADILKKYKVTRFITINVKEIKEVERVQKKRGRPSSSTVYEDKIIVLYTLGWHRNKALLQAEKNVDGCLPLLCTDNSLKAVEVLQAYKYQPRLEKRFEQLKSAHKVAPIYFKNIERVESNLFVFFIALMVQALLEREIRAVMLKNNIESLDIYPEERESKYPTANSILSAFENISRYKVVRAGKTIKEYKDELSKVQLQTLNLMGIQPTDYWK